ncbi:unnamed protein product [Arabis nemorensis]|uniref:Uncharacterized protein n=1 Tax=Arabis nemorensis TaxID=586526 RepID=A0A565C0F6_9BRAS|nr:unnamed protein product [Arabis nemorensis]
MRSHQIFSTKENGNVKPDKRKNKGEHKSENKLDKHKGSKRKTSKIKRKKKPSKKKSNKAQTKAKYRHLVMEAEFSLIGLLQDLSVTQSINMKIMYNKDRPKAERRELSARDLAEYIKSRTKKEKFSFRNLNIPINYIRHTRLRRDANATKQVVFDTLKLTPLGIVVEALKELELVGMIGKR